MADWNRVVPIPQIAPTNFTAATEFLNQLGADGYCLKTVHTWGHRNRFATGGLIATLNRWRYQFVQFNYKNPNHAAERLTQLGNEGWELVALYGQGSESATGCAVLKRPDGPLEITVPAELDGTAEPDAASPSEYDDAVSENHEDLVTV